MKDPKPDQPFFKTWHGWFIAILVASQLLIPFRYYIARRDPHDERFAWRMFSPMRMAQCTPEFTVDDKPFTLGSQFHEAWVETAKRGRFRVVEEMASFVCARHPGSSVIVRLKCKYIDHEPVEYGGFDMCNVPLL